MWIVSVTQNCVANRCVMNTGCHTFLHECVIALIGGSFPRPMNSTLSLNTDKEGNGKPFQFGVGLI